MSIEGGLYLPLKGHLDAFISPMDRSLSCTVRVHLTSQDTPMQSHWGVRIIYTGCVMDGGDL